AVPDMRVAVHDRHMAARLVALAQARRGLDQALEKLAPPARQAVAEAIAEDGKPLGETALVHRDGIVIGPCADRDAETRIVPPGGMEARPSGEDAAALLGRRRQRPGRDDHVRI